jgi:protoheme IX farnesyltransferase
MTTSVSDRSVLATYIELTKPRIIELLLVTTIPAMVVAADGWPGSWLIVVALVGGALSAGGANVINQVYDADIDRLMQRTVARPLPTDRVKSSRATTFGVLLGIAGFLVLALGANLLAGVLSAVAFLTYVFGYTMFLKRSTTQNIVIGGAAGAVPALIGWAAYADGLSMAPWVMFTIIYFWTPPHFWALSLKYEADYRAASIPMMPAIVGEAPTLANIFWYSIVASGVTVLLIPVAGFGWIYASTAVILSVLFVVLAARLRGDRSRAMKYFVYSNLFLSGVFLSMMVDRFAHTAPLGYDTVWFIAAAILVGLGMVGVLVVETRPDMRAPRVSLLRHGIELAITTAVAVVIVVLAWA